MSASTAKTPRRKRDIVLIGLSGNMTLCLKPEHFYKFLRKIKIPVGEQPGFLLDEDTAANVHFLKAPDKKRYAIVCMADQTGEPAEKTAALLVHEAVHIWQWHCEFISENSPSDEFEAYSIQEISRHLFEAYADAAATA